MTTSRIFGLLFLLALALMATLAAAQVPTPQPPPNQGYYPAPTIDGSGVVVIPVGPTSFVDDILNSPGVLTPGPTPPPGVPSVPDGFLQPGTVAAVTANTLNVRTAPSTEANIIGRLQRGEEITVLQLNPDLTWALVDTRGPLFAQGWVSTAYIAAFNDTVQNFAPNADNQGATGYQLRAQFKVNIRQRATLFSPRVGILPEGTVAQIIGRKSTYNWWKIQVDDTVGWVAAEYVYILNPAAYQDVPVLVD